MKYDRKALQSACAQAAEDHRKRWEAQRAAKQTKHDEAAAAWLREYGEDWLAAAKLITRTIRKGQPISSADLPAARRVRYQSLAVFDSPPPSAEQYQAVPELASLNKILDTIADDHVTTAALKELGIDSNTMRWVVQHMATASVLS